MARATARYRPARKGGVIPLTSALAILGIPAADMTTPPAESRPCFSRAGSALASDAFLDPLDVAAPHALDFAAKLEVTADLPVVENTEAVHDGAGLPDPLHNLIRIQLEIRDVADGQDDGIHTLHGPPQVVLHSFSFSCRWKNRDELKPGWG